MEDENTTETPFETTEEAKTKSKGRELRARGWLITQKADDIDQKDLIEKLKNYAYVGQMEEGGKTSYLHYQVYIESSNPIKFSTLKMKFPTAHLEVRRGTKRQAFDYCSKSDTRVGETFTGGDLDLFFENTLKLKDYIALITDEGLSVDEIATQYPQSAIHLRTLDAYAAKHNRVEAKSKRRELSVAYIWGATGVGKSHSIYERHGFDAVFVVDDYSHPFDEYDNETVIVFDEFHSQIPLEKMLKLLDPYPVSLSARYNNKWANFETVYVVSNEPIERQYPEYKLSKRKTWDAFYHRFDEITEMVGINHRAARRQEPNRKTEIVEIS